MAGVRTRSWAARAWLVVGLGACEELTIGTPTDQPGGEGDTGAGLADTDADGAPDAPMGPDGPLALDVTAPPRGMWTTDRVTVAGTVGPASAELSVNGAKPGIAGDGAFQTVLSEPNGVVVVRTEVAGSDDARLRDVRAVVKGPTEAADAWVSDALVIRMWEGAGGLGALGQLAVGLIDTNDLVAALPDPLYQDKEETCISWPWGGRDCVTTYALKFQATSITLGTPAFTIDPRADGTVRMIASVPSPQIKWKASGTLLEVNQSATGTITADRIDVVIDARIEVVDGGLVITQTFFDVVFVGLDLGLPGWINDVVGFFGVDLAKIAADEIESALKGELQDALPAALGDALDDLRLSQAIDLGGTTVTLEAEPQRVLVDDRAITVALRARIVSPSPGFGARKRYVQPRGQPPSVASTGAEVLVSIDVLNQAMVALDAGGLIALELSPSALGAGAVLLDSLFAPAKLDLFRVETTFPPIVAERDAAARLGLGDLRLTGLDAGGASLLEAWVSVDGALDISADAAGLALAVSGATVLSDVVVPVGENEGKFETLLDTVAGSLVTGVVNDLGVIALPLPDAVAITFGGPAVTRDGWLVLGGTLAAAP